MKPRTRVALLVLLLALLSGAAYLFITRQPLGESAALDGLEMPPPNELVTAHGFGALPGEVRGAPSAAAKAAPGSAAAASSGRGKPSGAQPSAPAASGGADEGDSGGGGRPGAAGESSAQAQAGPVGGGGGGGTGASPAGGGASGSRAADAEAFVRSLGAGGAGEAPELAGLAAALERSDPSTWKAKGQHAVALVGRLGEANKQLSILDEAYNQAEIDLESERLRHGGHAGQIQQRMTALTRGFDAKLAEQTRLRSELAGIAGQPAAPARTAPPPLPGASPEARTAVDTAWAQMGKPYVWAGAGPKVFDCSGLTMYSWKAAGVSMPHSALYQSRMFPAVERDQLEPGDLVFYGNPIHHVGMFVSKGRMINAPHPGAVVHTAPVFLSDYAGAVRPGARRR